VRNLSTLLLLAGVLLCRHSLAADPALVVLKNGDRLSGKIVSLRRGTLVLKSQAGTYRVAWDQVRSLDCPDPLEVQLRGGGSMVARLHSEGGAVVLQAASGKSFRVPPDGITALSPVERKELTEWDRWSGTLTFGATAKSGNTDSSALSSRLSVQRRGDSDRVSSKFGWDYVEVEGRVSDRRINGEVRYDYFVVPKVFAFTSHRGERSFAKELSLRYTGCLGGGYQFFESKPFELFADASIAYVNEDYKTDRSGPVPRSLDKEYLAAKLGAQATWRVRENLQVEQSVGGMVNVRNKEDLNLRSETLLKVEVMPPVGITFSLLFEFDNTPGRAKERLDVIGTAGLTVSF